MCRKNLYLRHGTWLFPDADPYPRRIFATHVHTYRFLWTRLVLLRWTTRKDFWWSITVQVTIHPESYTQPEIRKYLSNFLLYAGFYWVVLKWYVSLLTIENGKTLLNTSIVDYTCNETTVFNNDEFIFRTDIATLVSEKEWHPSKYTRHCSRGYQIQDPVCCEMHRKSSNMCRIQL